MYFGENRNNVVIGIILCLVIVGILAVVFIHPSAARRERERARIEEIANSVRSDFSYTFNVDEDFYEVGNMRDSSSPYWWLDSGARMIMRGGMGMTIQGSLPADDFWRERYARSNPVDTDNGYHPQNIFRLVGRSRWLDFRQEMYFTIAKINESPSPNRNDSNGILLMSRYVDGDNLYYTGLRVDGAAVIKKKRNGVYYTLAQNKVLEGEYDRSETPNLIPEGVPIGLRSEVLNTASSTAGAGGAVSIKLYMDIGRMGEWKLVAEAVDTGEVGGQSTGPVLGGRAFFGVRTDFMDVLFSDYRAEDLP